MRKPLILFAMLAGLAITPEVFADDMAIQGRWSPLDDSAVISVAPCAREAARLCAVVESDTSAPGEQSLVGQVVVRDLAPSGRGRWRGRYVEGGVDYGATVRFVSSRLIEFRVCAAPLLCETQRYQRSGG